MDKTTIKYGLFALVFILLIVWLDAQAKKRKRIAQGIEQSDQAIDQGTGNTVGSIVADTRPVYYANAATDAARIKSAGCYALFGVCVSWSNADTVIAVLRGKTKGQLAAIEEEFRKIYPNGLDAWIRSNFYQEGVNMIYAEIARIKNS